ncbi:unnamed protein product [Lymnaea stagnalis]|uniref:G-protein coupled receptors family 1 profile domain-containing protein n=1 Tax=Lymnaea stagnalis TaxID=6523 RepID=A0AAV2HWU0_LYMST
MSTDQEMTEISRVDKQLNIYVSPIMVILSWIGNVLSIMILRRKAFRSMPMSVYLRFLAVMDAGTVVTGLLPRFVVALTGYDVRGTNELSCQFQVYTVYVFTELSAWTLVIVTTERVISIVRPHKVKLLCTKHTSYAALLVATIFLAGANIPIFFFFGQAPLPSESKSSTDVIQQYPNSAVTGGGALVANRTVVEFLPCGIKGDNQFKQTWFVTHFLKQSLLPFVILFVFNIVIIVSLIKRRNSFKTKYANDAVKSAANDAVNDSKEHLDAPGNADKSHVAQKRPNMASRKDTSICLMLVTVNAVFLICNFPIGIYQQVEPTLPREVVASHGNTLLYTFLVFILYLNNTLNFVLYCVSGSRFRTELWSMCQCQKQV